MSSPRDQSINEGDQQASRLPQGHRRGQSSPATLPSQGHRRGQSSPATLQSQIHSGARPERAGLAPAQPTQLRDSTTVTPFGTQPAVPTTFGRGRADRAPLSIAEMRERARARGVPVVAPRGFPSDQRTRPAPPTYGHPLGVGSGYDPRPAIANYDPANPHEWGDDTPPPSPTVRVRAPEQQRQAPTPTLNPDAAPFQPLAPQAAVVRRPDNSGLGVMQAAQEAQRQAEEEAARRDAELPLIPRPPPTGPPTGPPRGFERYPTAPETADNKWKAGANETVVRGSYRRFGNWFRGGSSRRPGRPEGEDGASDSARHGGPGRRATEFGRRVRGLLTGRPSTGRGHGNADPDVGERDRRRDSQERGGEGRGRDDGSRGKGK